jgi:hypothetical protein
MLAIVVGIMSVSMFGEPVVQALVGDGAQAQSRKGGSSACYQNCRNVRDWPAAQCRSFCKGRS